MAASLTHRGPDDDGYYNNEAVAFGFRRLAVIDLDTGAQPLCANDERIVGMFNGEIYNYVELRRQLVGRGYVFRTESDTEVMLNAYQEYGLDFVAKLRGMFAIAIWDGRSRQVVICRDRIGKKPLFYSTSGNQFAFASELTALYAWGRLGPKIDPISVDHYLSLLCVPAPRTILQNAFKLPPAHLLVVDTTNGSTDLRRYWRPSYRPDYSLSPDQHAERLRETLSEAVRLRLRSDVPLGVFLSGGIDSTIVAGLVSRMVTGGRSFSMGFSDPRFDESQCAARTARRFGLQHHEEHIAPDSIGPGDLLAMLNYLDEPLGDSSFVPTFQVAAMARRHVTVALSGDGGDELFAGYSSYGVLGRLNQLAGVPGGILRAAALLSGNAAADVAALSSAAAGRLWRLQKAFAVAAMPEAARAARLRSYFWDADKERLGVGEFRDAVRSADATCESWLGREWDVHDDCEDPIARSMASEFATTLVDDLLVKVDRASMAVSLEVRCPLLDHEVVEVAAAIPMRYKRRGERGKMVLKAACADLLPDEVAHGKKRGFELSFGDWFTRRPWRDFLCDALSPESVGRLGLFKPREVVKLRDQLIADPEATTSPLSAYQQRNRVWLLMVLHLWHDRLRRSAGAMVTR